MKRARMRIFGLLLTALGAACGRSAFDFSGSGGTPTPTATPTASASGTPISTPNPARVPVPGDLVVTEIFARDEGTDESDADLSTASAGGDDRFVEIANVTEHPVLMNGVQVFIDNFRGNDGGPILYHTFPPETLLAGGAVAIFNPGSGADLSAISQKTGGAVVEGTGPGRITTNMDNTDPPFQVEILAEDGSLLEHFAANRDANLQVTFEVGPAPQSLQTYTITIADDPCSDLFCNGNDGVYSLVLGDSRSAPGPTNHYTDHRLLTHSSSACTGDVMTDFPCCEMSPGRYFDAQDPAGGCADFP